MDIVVLSLIASILLVAIVLIGFYFGKIQKKEQDKPRPQQNRVRNAAPRRAQLARNRGVRIRANVAAHDQHDSDEDREEETEKPDIDLPEGKIGAKKRAKLEAKAEKKAAREAEEQLRAEKKKKTELAEEERKKLEEKEKAEEKRREEDERRAKEEQERKEYEEYLKMKEAFAVEEEGYEEGEEESKNLLQEFVDFIKSNKVVVIEDLASQFKLKTQAVIDRIRDLQNDDILTGVIDDRGKFIYVSPEEMEAVAKFIRQQGRVSIAELAENSNKLINLMPAVVTT